MLSASAELMTLCIDLFMKLLLSAVQHPCFTASKNYDFIIAYFCTFCTPPEKNYLQLLSSFFVHFSKIRAEK